MHSAPRFIISILCAFLPFAAGASPSVVQSGEHNGFTRLVASVPLGAAWRVEKNGKTVFLHLDGHTDGFETSSVYDKIGVDRIAALSSTNKSLSINLACDCRVAVFEAGPQYVALDVFSDGVQPDIAFLEDTRSELVNKEELAPPARAEQSSSNQDLPFPSAATGQSRSTIGRQALSPKEKGLLNDLQQQLSRELGGAATRGLLDQSEGLPLINGKNSHVDPSVFAPQVSKPSPLPDALSEQKRNIRITSSMDIPHSASMDQNSLSGTGILCPTDNDLDIANWGGNAPFHAQVGSARENLFGEFDRLNSDVALKLARTYLHFGFGAEARQILTLDPVLAQDQTLLIAISDIMEQGVATGFPQLRDFLECKSDIALWAILAGEELDVSGSIDASAALLALNKLPPHLRSFLAPALSRRLLKHGDTPAAATALRSLERLPEKISPAGRLALAEVSLDEGETEKGKAQLADVIDDNAAQSPQALIALVDAQLKSHQPISHETAGLIEAYAQELQDTELGPELRRAHVVALVKSGQFDRAFQATKALGSDANDSASVRLRLQIIEELTTAADDVVFLDNMFRQSDADIGKLPVTARLNLAERYLSLGFGQAAQLVIDTIPERPQNADRQMLTARISLALERPALAQASLIGLDGEDADLIRARAKQLAGEHDDAFQIYQDNNRPENAARTAWLAEDWQTLTALETPVFGPVAALSLNPIEVDPSYEGMLARTNDALQESSNARQLLNEMLRSPDLQLDATRPAN